jgi:hypothetical protein
MDRIRGRLLRGGEVLLGQVEGGIGSQSGDPQAWCGYLVVPRDRLGDVADADDLRLDLEDGRSFRIDPDPAAAGPTPDVVMAFRCAGSAPVGG